MQNNEQIIDNQFISWEDYVEFCNLYSMNLEKFKYKGFELVLKPNYVGHSTHWYISTNLKGKLELNTWVYREKKEAIASAKNLIDMGDKDFLARQISQSQKNQVVQQACQIVQEEASKNTLILQKLITILIVNSKKGKIPVWENILAQGLDLTTRALLNRNKKLLELGLLKDMRRIRKTMVTWLEL